MRWFLKKFIRDKRGFSLIEIAIGLSIIGVMATCSIKGRALLESVKLRSISQQVQSFRMSVQTYLEKEGRLPSKESFWRDLVESECLDGVKLGVNPSSKMGGEFVYVDDAQYSGIWVKLVSSDGNGVITLAHAQSIDAYLDNGDPDSGDVRYKLSDDKRALCIVYFRLW